MDTTTERHRRSDGERTHAAILDAAARLASVEGIHGLTLGRLAASLGVSKSGLYAHFGSKEQLQLETIEAAMAIFDREVVRSAEEAPPGLARLEAFVDAFFSYVERDVFPGGCFFAGLLAEVDARGGPIHEITAGLERGTLEWMAAPLRDARRLKEVPRKLDPDQVAFEVYACMELANYHFVLFRDPAILARGRRAIAGIIDRARA